MSSFSGIGLTRYEEAVYTSLLRLGRSDARKISSDSRVPPTAVYPNLKSLVAKGLAQKAEGEVALYEALDPKTALSVMHTRQKAALEAAFQSSLSEAMSIPKRETHEKEPISVSIGKDTSAQLFAEFSEKAKEKVYILGWKFRDTTKNIALLKRLIKLKAGKKDVRLITNNPEPKKNWMLSQIIKAGVPVRMHATSNFSIIIRDSEEAKITLKNPKLEERTNIHIEDKDLSLALEEYFLSLWRKARPAK